MTNYALSGSQAGLTRSFPTSFPVNQSLSVNNNFGLPQSLAGATGNGGVYQIMGSDFTATLQAIATAGKAQVLSRPSILARDGQMAEIVVGQSVYLPSSVSLTSVGNSATTVPTINGTYQNVGIQLDVTPFIGANNLVQMILEPQITSIDTSTPGQVIQGGSLISSAVYAPNLNKRSANTVVVTPDGQPVVIGGLIANDKSSSDSKMPISGRHSAARQAFQVQRQVEPEERAADVPHAAHRPDAVAARRDDRAGKPARRRSSPIRFRSRNWIVFWNACR